MTNPLQIIRSNRRSLSLQINRHGELIIRAPFSFSENKIKAFVDEKQQWIEKAIEKVKKRNEFVGVAKSFVQGEMLYYLGEQYRLDIVKPKRGMGKLYLENEFKLSAKYQDKAKRIFEKWYKNEFRILIQDRVDFYSSLMKLNYSKIKISSARTKWGSCSGRNTLSFVWKLIMASIEVIDYVVIHEIAHIKHKNHSKDFWRLVESFCPNYKSFRKWLKTEGMSVCYFE